MQTLTYMYFYVELVYARQAREESQNETLARSDSFDRRRYACEASEESEGSSDGVSDDSINFGARAREWRVDADGAEGQVTEDLLTGLERGLQAQNRSKYSMIVGEEVHEIGEKLSMLG